MSNNDTPLIGHRGSSAATGRYLAQESNREVPDWLQPRQKPIHLMPDKVHHQLPASSDTWSKMKGFWQRHRLKIGMVLMGVGASSVIVGAVTAAAFGSGVPAIIIGILLFEAGAVIVGNHLWQAENQRRDQEGEISLGTAMVIGTEAMIAGVYHLGCGIGDLSSAIGHFIRESAANTWGHTAPLFERTYTEMYDVYLDCCLWCASIAERWR